MPSTRHILITGSNGYIGSIDTTGPVDEAKHWQYRLVMSGQDLHPFRRGDYERDFYLYPSLTYQWSKETYVTVKVEDIQEKRRLDDGLRAQQKPLRVCVRAGSRVDRALTLTGYDQLVDLHHSARAAWR